MTWRDLVRQFHPDVNGGDHSRVLALTKLMAERRRLCHCGCGRSRPHQRLKFATRLCALRHRYYRHALA